MASGEEGVSSLGALSRNWRSALVVNSLHDALEESERERDQLAQILSKNQKGQPIFADSGSGDRPLLDDDDSAPRHGSTRGGTTTNGVEMKRSRPPLLRHSFLATPPLTVTTSPTWNTARSRPDEQKPASEPGRRGRDIDRFGNADRMPPPPRTRGTGGEMQGVRSGGRVEQEAGLRLSATSIGSVGGELRGGELERVRGRVADLGVAIETSQSKLLKELSQVQEDFFSSFGYTPPLGASAASSGADFAAIGSSGISSIPLVASAANSHSGHNGGGRSPRWGPPMPRDRSPLRHSDLVGPTAGAGPRSSRPGTTTRGRVSRVKDGDGGDGSGCGGGRALPVARTVDETSYAFPAGSRASSPRKWRSLSPPASDSPRSHGDWSRGPGGGGGGRRSPVDTAGANELKERLLKEMVEKEELERELEDSRKEAEDYRAGQEETAKELDHLQTALRTAAEQAEAAEDKATALERSLSEQQEESEGRGARLKEAAEKERQLEVDRDRAVQEYASLRRVSTERAVSLFLREKKRALLHAATSRWKAAAREERRLNRLADRMASWRTCRALARWRCESGLSKSARNLPLKDTPSSALRRRGVAFLRQWVLLARRRKRLRRVVKTRAIGDMRRGWSIWRAAAAAIAAESQRAGLGHAEELLRVAEDRIGSLQLQLDQSKEQTEVKSHRVATVRSKSLERNTLRRNARAAFDAWAAYSRRRSRACKVLSRLLHRGRREMLANSFRKLSVEAGRTVRLDRALLRYQAARQKKSTAYWWSRLVEGVKRQKQQKQALEGLLVKRPVHAAFASLKRRTARRRVTQVALGKLCRSMEAWARTRMADALRIWSRQASLSSSAAVALARVLRRRDARRMTAALDQLRRTVVQARTNSSLARLERLEETITAGHGKARRAAGAALIGALVRGRRRSLEWGFGMLEEEVLVARKKSQALDRLSFLHHRHGLVVASVALSLWRRRVAAHALTAHALRRLGRIARRRVLLEAIGRWKRAAEAERAAELLTGLAERAMTRVLLTRGLRRWRAEGLRWQNEEAHRRGERCRRVLSGRVAAASRRAVLLRCLAEWKVHTITRRCQLRSARSFLLARNRRVLRGALVAWRDSRRGRAETARALAGLARAIKTAMLRNGFRQLRVSARQKEREEAAAIVAASRLETAQAKKDLDGVNARLLDATEAARRLTRERAFADDRAEAELRRALRRTTALECFAAWKGLAQSEHRKRACVRRLLLELSRRSVRGAFSLWREGARASAALGLAERLLVGSRRRELLHRTIRAWAYHTRRRRYAAVVLSRIARCVANFDKRRARRAFLAIKTVVDLRRTRVAEFGRACAKLRAVSIRRENTQVARAFNLWARLSGSMVRAERSAETGAVAKRHKMLRSCISALSRNASTRRSGRRALLSLGRCLDLRRLARGWAAIVAAAAAVGASSDVQTRLRAAEARVVAGRVATRARAHRTARRLLGVARGRAALEAFVAWRGYVREGRGARLGAAALEARSKRRLLRDTLACWRAESLASSRLRARALSQISVATNARIREAFTRWRQRSRAGHIADSAVTALKRVSERRRSDRVGMRLAFQSWKREAFGGEGGGDRSRGVQGEDWESESEQLEALAGVSVEAAEAFSAAVSVSQVFEVVEALVSMAAPLSRGRLYLLSGEPGELFCQESGRAANPEREPVEVSFPVGNGLVGRCVATGLPFQASTGYDCAPAPHRRYNSNNNSITLNGSADLHGLFPQQQGWASSAGNVAFRKSRISGAGTRNFAAPDSASTAPAPPASWGHSTPVSAPGASAIVAGAACRSPVAGGVRHRSRLAFFPADSDDSRSPSPPRLSPGSPTKMWFGGSKSPPPRPLGDGRRGVVVDGEGSVREDRVWRVACVPVVCGGGSGGHAMLGVMKAWRPQQGEADSGDQPPISTGFTAGEMAALGVVAGQAAAALRRLDVQMADQEGGAQSEEQRDKVVKAEIERLRETMQQLSDSAQGLAKQRDDARAALARVKGTLRRMGPALRDVRDRQLGFRHYHDLIVTLSRSVLQGDLEEEPASPTRSAPMILGDTIRYSNHRATSPGGTRSASRRCSPARSRSPRPVAEAAATAVARARGGTSYTAGPVSLGRKLAGGGANQGFGLSSSKGSSGGGAGGGRKVGSAILTILREAAAGGSGEARDRGRPRERPQRD